jgi:hypothetical protein
MYPISTSSLLTDLAGQHVDRLLKEADRERLTRRARAARRRRQQRHRAAGRT